VTVCTVRIEGNGPERRELMQALLTWATVARHEAGGLRVHVYEDLESPGAFYLASHWSSPESMERHLCGPDFGILLGALELLARPPRVIVTEVADEGEQDAFLRIRRLRDRARRAAHPDPFRDVS
jgi:quinol monooxygenase YgiN